MCRTRFRRFAALVAAYAVALQVMFSGVVMPAPVAQAGASPDGTICGVDGGPIAPAQSPAHDACLACLAGHCSGGAAGDDRVVIVVPWPPAPVLIDAPVRYVALAPTPRERPHSPRAPPAG